MLVLVIMGEGKTGRSIVRLNMSDLFGRKSLITTASTRRSSKEGIRYPLSPPLPRAYTSPAPCEGHFRGTLHVQGAQYSSTLVINP